VNLHSVADEAVWRYAREHDFTVVSKDADFSEISMQLGYPPKLIWLQIRNWSTDQVEELIRSGYSRIIELPTATNRAILVLFKKRR
jgi:predicted nuclease of predicted toxin-antitoxin system